MGETTWDFISGPRDPSTRLTPQMVFSYLVEKASFE
jgi:hypothetical protein